ncbi:MAG: SDH family Clp fold serine proteinase [Bacillota bacterium]
METSPLSFLINTLWFVVLFGTFLLPLLRQRRIEALRLALIRQLEATRKSRVITLIHRQEAINFLGIPITRYINIEDSEQVLRAIRFTPDDMPIDLIVHTPGGLVLAAEQIALALCRHKAKVTVFVPHYAMSGGTLLALAADEIVMDENAVLGPVDPQIGSYPAASILNVVRAKGVEKVDDNTLIMADIAEKAIRQVKQTVDCILREKLPEQEAERISKLLTEGYFTHDYPLTFDQLKSMGLPVRAGLPTEVYELMELYPQPAQLRPSVQYIPVPYHEPRRLPREKA